jgi:uncharacterized protein YlxW (UPF0749 family)
VSAQTRPPTPGAQMLADLLSNHLDPGYAAAAERRHAADSDNPNRRPFLRAASGVAAGLVGLILAVAYGQTVAHAPEATRTRAALVAEVRVRTGQTSSLERRASSLRAEIARQRAALLAGTTAGADAESSLRELESLTGLGKVHGPGITVTVADGPPAVDPLTGKPTGAATPERIQDRDLQDLVNALWAAGAEAVSINDQRLWAASAIRSAGEAVLVDFKPVASPYVLSAVGSPSLAAAFGASDAAARFRGYVRQYGMKLDVRTVADLSLAPGPPPDLRYAAPVPSPTTGTPPSTAPRSPVPSSPGGGR